MKFNLSKFINVYLVVASLLGSTAFADNLNFQSYQACADFFQPLYFAAQNPPPDKQNQWGYQFLFMGLLGRSSATYQDNCTNGSCIFTAQVGGCRVIKFSNAYINGVDSNNTLWNKLVPALQTQLTNYYNNVDTSHNINHGIANVTCPHPQGQKADIGQCNIAIN